jgi:chloride channel 3/4/5
MNTGPTTNTILSYLNSSADAGIGLQDSKDASGLDWYVEGPGRRVGYDNLTAIDWIYEYSKERMRLQHLLTNAPGLFGQLRVLADSSQIWLILIATGIAVGGIAAGIDVASDWMGDLKTGVCSNVDKGGKFYLNKTFCCWGEDSMEACKDWRSWSSLMGIGNKAGGYIIEYITFTLFSVSHPTVTILEYQADHCTRFSSPLSPRSLSSGSRLTQSSLAFQKSRPSLVVSSFGAS